MDVAIQTIQENKKEKNEPTKFKFSNALIDFKALWMEWKSKQKNHKSQEMIDLNSKSTQTKVPKIKRIKHLVKTAWFIALFTSIASFANDFFDLGTDGLLAYRYKHGKNYTWRVDYTPEGKYLI